MNNRLPYLLAALVLVAGLLAYYLIRLRPYHTGVIMCALESGEVVKPGSTTECILGLQKSSGRFYYLTVPEDKKDTLILSDYADYDTPLTFKGEVFQKPGRPHPSLNVAKIR